MQTLESWNFLEPDPVLSSLNGSGMPPLAFTLPLGALGTLTVRVDGLRLGGLETFTDLDLLNPIDAAAPLLHSRAAATTLSLQALLGIDLVLGNTTVSGHSLRQQVCPHAILHIKQ